MSKSAGSILAADFGSVQTRVVLLDVVDGEYRMVARGAGMTTIGYPINDVGVGLQRIISQMAKTGQRRLLDDTGQVITPEDNQRRGVDYFLTTASLGRPMQAVLVGLVPGFSLLSGLRAISSAYIEPVAQIHLRDEATEEDRLNKIVLNQPDLVFISGGTDKGAEASLLELLDSVRLAVHLIERARRPVIVYAGNASLTEKVEELFEGLTPLLLIADNVLPEIDRETTDAVQQKLGNAYDEYQERESEGFVHVRDTSTGGILPTAQNYSLLAEYLMQSRGGNVLAVDAGSTSSLVVGAFNGQTAITISTKRGIGHSAKTLYDDVGAAAIEQWLPFYPERGELVNYALNKSLRPAVIPMNVRDFYLEYALLRAALRQQMLDLRPALEGVTPGEPLPPVDMILVGGAPLTASGHPAYTLLLVADSLQPTGITDVKADPDGLVPALGALARYNPEAAVQLLDGDNLEHVGTLINFEGTPEHDKTVASLTITDTDGEVFEHELSGGHIWSLPLPADHMLEIKIRCKGGMRVSGKRRLTVQVRGGTGGVLLDARGRPFHAGATPEERAEHLPAWLQEATGSINHEIPAAWLEAPDEPADTVRQEEVTALADEDDTSEPEQRRGFLSRLFGRGGDGTTATAGSEADDIGEEELDDFFAMADDDPDDTDDRDEQTVDDPAGDLRNML